MLNLILLNQLFFTPNSVKTIYTVSVTNLCVNDHIHDTQSTFSYKERRPVHSVTFSAIITPV